MKKLRCTLSLYLSMTSMKYFKVHLKNGDSKVLIMAGNFEADKFEGKTDDFIKQVIVSKVLSEVSDWFKGEVKSESGAVVQLNSLYLMLRVIENEQKDWNVMDLFDIEISDESVENYLDSVAKNLQ